MYQNSEKDSEKDSIPDLASSSGTLLAEYLISTLPYLSR